MPPRTTIFAVLLTSALSGAAATAEPNVAGNVLLTDFEDTDCLRHVQTDGDVTVELSQEHVHSGDHSLAVHLGDWAEGGSEVDKGFPGVRVHMDGPRRDWSFHAILEAWAYLPQPMEHFYFELRDDERTKCFHNPSQVVGEWFPIRVGLGVFGARLSSVDHAFFYSHKPSAATFYIDDLRLGEPRPEWVDERLAALERTLGPLTRFLRMAGEVGRDTVTPVRKAGQIGAGAAEVVERARSRYADRNYPLGQAQDDTADLERCWRRANRLGRECLTEWAQAVEPVDEGRPPASIWLADSMTKVLPRDVFAPGRLVMDQRLSLARNESESFQICIGATKRLRNARVIVSDLETDRGAVLPASCLTAHPVGFVRTRRPQRYRADYTGWWPDPILTFLDSVDVRPGDMQSFWITIHAPAEQPDGTYRGEVRFEAHGIRPVPIPLEVRVFPFTLPDRPSLPTAITVLLPNEGEKRQQVLDFVRRYKIMPDNIQRRTPPAIEELAALKRTGWVGRFNLLQMHGFMATFDDARRLGEINHNLELIEAVKPELQELGLWQRAYVYGFDEAYGEAVWHAMRQAFGAVKERYPELMTLSSAYDRTYGIESGVEAVDAWCPRTSDFDPKRVRAARRRGKQVWWYICIGPRHPYANWFIEYPAIETRLLMGAMAAKYRPDGFLYYAANMWSNEPITSGPYTDWDPSFQSNNGDGQIFSEGPHGLIPTIRVENFRDGMEDYEYYLVLEKLAGEARVSSNVVTDLTHFTRDPAELYRERARIAARIARIQPNGHGGVTRELRKGPGGDPRQ